MLDQRMHGIKEAKQNHFYTGLFNGIVGKEGAEDAWRTEYEEHV